MRLQNQQEPDQAHHDLQESFQYDEPQQIHCLEYNHATPGNAQGDDDDEFQNDADETSPDGQKPRKILATAAAVLFVVEGMTYLGNRLLTNDDDELDDAAAIIDHTARNASCPPLQGSSKATTVQVAPAPPPQPPPPPTQQSPVLQQMASQAAANAAGAVGAGAAGAAAVGMGVAAA